MLAGSSVDEDNNGESKRDAGESTNDMLSPASFFLLTVNYLLIDTILDADDLSPALSVTVNVTVTEPFREYECTTFARLLPLVPVEPSPKFHE